MAKCRLIEGKTIYVLAWGLALCWVNQAFAVPSHQPAKVDSKPGVTLPHQGSLKSSAAQPSVAISTLPVEPKKSSLPKSPYFEVISQIKPEILKKVREGREVYARADLVDLDANIKKYDFIAVMAVKASAESARKKMTDYRLYVENVPYIEKADFNEKKQQLYVRGGVWKYYLESLIQFYRRPSAPPWQEWIDFEIIAGHFRGLKGQMIFEPDLGPGPTINGMGGSTGQSIVIFKGGITAIGKWPPKLIVTRGAEIVFEFTGKRMRNSIEKLTEPTEGSGHDPNIPQPRKGIGTGI
jgi:hypothetical protein